MPRQQQVAEADDGGQQIVEIMRHTTGQLPDGLHLLRLSKLQFERFLLGRINQIGDRRACPVGHINTADVEKPDALRAFGQPHFNRRRRHAPRARCCKALHDARAVFLDHQLAKIGAALYTVANIGKEGAVGIVDPAFAVHSGNADGRIVEEAREPHFRIPRALFGLVACGAIEHHAPIHRLARRSALNQGLHRPHRKNTAIGTAQINISDNGAFNIGPARQNADVTHNKFGDVLRKTLGTTGFRA